MRQQGFTLVEILVVVVIMAVVISLAVLSIGVTGHDAQLDEESRRIAGLLGLLHERALLEGRDFGMFIEPDAYGFAVYDVNRDRWFPFDQESEYRHRALPKGLAFQLELDSQLVVLKPPDPNLTSDSAPPAPQVAVAASGEGTPFRLTLLREATQAKATVCGDAWGRIGRASSDERAAADARTPDQQHAVDTQRAASLAAASAAASAASSAGAAVPEPNPCDAQPAKKP
jgi:general secretion pathway protein H